MKYVLDSSAIIEGFSPPLDQEIIIPPGVLEEVKNKGYEFEGMKIISPERRHIEKIEEIARKTGDFEVLSPVDIEILALALQENAIIITDDYAIQNVAEHMGIKWISLHQRGIKKKVRWKWRCESCGRYYSKYYDTCPVCGGKLRRVRIK